MEKAQRAHAEPFCVLTLADGLVTWDAPNGANLGVGRRGWLVGGRCSHRKTRATATAGAGQRR